LANLSLPPLLRHSTLHSPLASLGSKRLTPWGATREIMGDGGHNPQGCHCYPPTLKRNSPIATLTT
jgi:hypothetical protein